MVRRPTLDRLAFLQHVQVELHAGQMEVYRSDASRRIVSAGARWGRSRLAVADAAASLMAPAENGIGLLVAPTVETALLLLRRVLGMIQRHFDHRIVEIGENERRFVVCNLGGGQSAIVARAGDNPASFPIEAIDWVVVDGAEWLRESTWSTHLAPLLVEKQARALVLGVPVRGEWFRELLIVGQDGAPGYASWSRPSTENPAVDAALVERERARMSPEHFAAVFEGRFLGRGAVRCPVCGGPDPDAMVVTVLKNDEQLCRCQACGNPIDSAGRPLGRIAADGKLQLQIVVVQAPPEAPSKEGSQG